MNKAFYLTTFWSICLLSFFMTSCDEALPETESMPAAGNRVEWDLSLPSTRATFQTDGSGRFEEGDTLVVYAQNLENGQMRHFTLHLQDGQWKPELYWSEIGREVQFTAWHVAGAHRLHQTSQTSQEYIHTLATEQQPDAYRHSDLLTAQTRVTAGQRVQLRFEHALNRLRLQLESKDASYTPEQLQQAEVQVYTPCRLPFDLTDGTLHEPSAYQWVSPLKLQDGTWAALLCPQATQPLKAEGWIRLRIDGKETVLPVPETMDGKPFERLEAGKEITYRIHVQKGVTPDDFAATTRWVYGVKEPLPEQWNADHTQLKWTEGCGWFDCNKTNPSGITAGSDGLMCWAAATSNLLHWWLKQNEETEAVKAYTGPAAIPTDMLHSEIFQLYKDHFPNAGNYPLKAINWFFNGVFHNRIYDTDPIDPAAGFFRTQLGTRTLGKEYIGNELSRDRFNAIIKQALTSRQGILFIINQGKNWSTHAVTLWGARFDDEGLIDTLYMVDNNDGRSDTRGTIRVMGVQYRPYSSSNPELYPYVPNSLGDFTIRIESLCTLSLGREWIN